jgi:hypothetical protein
MLFWPALANMFTAGSNSSSEESYPVSSRIVGLAFEGTNYQDGITKDVAGRDDKTRRIRMLKMDGRLKNLEADVEKEPALTCLLGTCRRRWDTLRGGSGQRWMGRKVLYVLRRRKELTIPLGIHQMVHSKMCTLR